MGPILKPMRGYAVRLGRLVARPWGLFGALVVVFVVGGCGKPTEFGVAGKVTLNGKPLEEAMISFLPDNETQLGAVARTDSEGMYQVEISEDRPGLAPGSYVVRISTYDEGDLEADPPLLPVRERVPREYNEDSTLRVDVKPQENTFDFQLGK